jgi:hypothetical protein
MPDEAGAQPLDRRQTDNSFGALTARRLVFYGVFVFLIIVYLLIVPMFYVTPGISVAVMSLVAIMSPIVKADIAFVGDLVPAILGAVIGGSAPKTANLRQLIVILIVACFTYLLYVHMTAFFAGTAGKLSNVELNTALIGNGIRVETLQALANSSRNFTVFVVSTLIGIRFNASGWVEIPLQRPAHLDPNVPKQNEQNEEGEINAGGGHANG